MNKKGEGEITIVIIIILALFYVYWQFGCLFHVGYYDDKISDLDEKISAIECDSDLEDARCRELYFNRNKFVEKRNKLMCVENSTHPLSILYTQ